MDRTITIYAIYTGQPQTMNDEHGVWRSSIYRNLVEGPVALGLRGLAGDQVTDTRNHGRPEQAVCCHPLAHYQFWNEHYAMRLRPGNVGENWTLENADEDQICIGDVFQVGTARVQVSVPRVPCSKQSRRVGRADWVDLTLKELRTGFYLSVLTPGTVQAGDVWHLEKQPNPGASIQALNRCTYHQFEPDVARAFLSLPDLHGYWRTRLERRLIEQV